MVLDIEYLFCYGAVAAARGLAALRCKLLLVQQDFIDTPVQSFLGDRAVLHSLQDGGVGLGQGVGHQKYITARLKACTAASPGV